MYGKRSSWKCFTIENFVNQPHSPILSLDNQKSSEKSDKLIKKFNWKRSSWKSLIMENEALPAVVFDSLAQSSLACTINQSKKIESTHQLMGPLAVVLWPILWAFFKTVNYELVIYHMQFYSAQHLLFGCPFVYM